MKNSELTNPLFKSYFVAGFECSTHLNCHGRRLDLVASTKHDRFADRDYARMVKQNIHAAREGIRWHLIEDVPGKYNFSSVRNIIDAANKHRINVVWDIFHFGYPDHLDIMGPEFPDRAAKMAKAFAIYLKQNSDMLPCFVPVNEISYFAFDGGETGNISPHLKRQGDALKRQLIKTSIAIMNSVRSVMPMAKFVHVDPIINVTHHPDRPQDHDGAESYRLSQYQAWDMLSGRMCPELKGRPDYVDIIGVNFYGQNQWRFNPITGQRTDISLSYPDWKPFRTMLMEVYERYKKTIFISETGAEGPDRAPWLKYVITEVAAAIESGVPVGGICIYPVTNYLGWDNDRDCETGLWDHADDKGERELYLPLWDVIQKAQQVFK